MIRILSRRILQIIWSWKCVAMVVGFIAVATIALWAKNLFFTPILLHKRSGLILSQHQKDLLDFWDCLRLKLHKNDVCFFIRLYPSLSQQLNSWIKGVQTERSFFITELDL
ncbi:MAG TPA: hypothetical protein VHK67_07430, partial [Rhabdochlamydiaceae bacterium]|nr:hypothetical protein [Rhabdochlamydiaceae bacterium]